MKKTILILIGSTKLLRSSYGSDRMDNNGTDAVMNNTLAMDTTIIGANLGSND